MISFRCILLTLMMAPLGACSGGPDDASEGKAAFDFEIGAAMLPGENCLRCHSEGSAYPSAPIWSAAGTVFERADSEVGVRGATVRLVDSAGKELELTTNAAGNFYTSEPLVFPLRASLSFEGFEASMPVEVPAGSCNACHSHPDPSGGAQGHIRVAR